MTISVPVSLYRYRSLYGQGALRTREIICDHKLHFAKPLDFNDPFDCRPVFDMKAPKKNINKFYDRIYTKRAPNMNREMRRAEVRAIHKDAKRNPFLPGNQLDFRKKYHAEVTSKIGMACFSEVGDDILMWSHYASAHSGVCCIFDAQSDFFAEAQQVLYETRRPQMNPFRQSYEVMADHALLTKSDHWKYEREWRLINYTRGSGIYVFPERCLVGVILGAAISPGDEELVLGWIAARTRPVEVFKASTSDVEFVLAIKPLQRVR